MVSRRRALGLLGGSLLGAGCTTADPTDTESTTPATRSSGSATSDPTDDPSSGGDDPKEWDDAWTTDTEHGHVLGLDPSPDGTTVYAATATEGGPSAVVALDPSSGERRWRTPLDGEVSASAYDGRGDGDDKWGVTVTDDAVYVVAGRADEREWTALHALDVESGTDRWSRRRERFLAVHGVREGVVYLSEREFFTPEHSHDTPEDPLAERLVALNADDGSTRWTAEHAGVADVAVGTGGVVVAAGRTLAGYAHPGDSGDDPELFSVGTAVEGAFVGLAGDRVFYAGESGSDGRSVRGYDFDGSRAWGVTRRVRDLLVDPDRGILYGAGNVVLAVDVAGERLWRVSTRGGHPLVRGPDGGSLYVRAGGGVAAAITLPDGEPRWSFDPPEQYAWPDAAGPGTAVVEGFAEGRTLYAVDAATGEATRKRGFGNDATLFSVETVDGTAFVGTGDGRVVALPLPGAD